MMTQHATSRPNKKSQEDKTLGAGRDISWLQSHQIPPSQAKLFVHGVEWHGASNASQLRDAWRHTQTRDSRKVKLGEEVEEGRGYIHTKFQLPKVMHLGMA